MSYCTAADITDLYGNDLLVRVADHNKDHVADPEVVQKGIQAADELCDAYLSAQYTVPVTPTPGIVRSCAIDIAVYKMAHERTRRTEEMRQRFEDALKLLEKISTGKVGLGLPPVDPDGPDNPDAPVDPNRKRRGRFLTVGRA